MKEASSCSVLGIFKRVFSIVSDVPVIVTPFVFLALTNIFGLLVAYYSPRDPIAIVMGPPIRRFMGEQFMHYPQFFAILPKLFYYGSFCVSITLGLIFTAYVLHMVKCSLSKEKFLMGRGLFVAISKYIPMLVVYLAFFFIAKGLGNLVLLVLNLIPSPVLKQLVAVPFDVAIVVLVQTLAFFMFPLFIMRNERFFDGLIHNFKLLKQHGLTAAGVVFFPTLLFIVNRLLIIVNPLLARIFGLESTVAILMITVVVNVFVDMVITIGSGVVIAEGNVA